VTELGQRGAESRRIARPLREVDRERGTALGLGHVAHEVRDRATGPVDPADEGRICAGLLKRTPVEVTRTDVLASRGGQVARDQAPPAARRAVLGRGQRQRLLRETRGDVRRPARLRPARRLVERARDLLVRPGGAQRQVARALLGIGGPVGEGPSRLDPNPEVLRAGAG
jgi:hypothetical protein